MRGRYRKGVFCFSRSVPVDSVSAYGLNRICTFCLVANPLDLLAPI